MAQRKREKGRREAITYILKNPRRWASDWWEWHTLNIKYITKNKLLHETFGHILCYTCGNKMTQYNFSKKLIKRQKCSSCSPNPEEIKIAKKADLKRYRRNYVVKITRNYAAEAMNIPIKDLSDELYEHYKKVLFFKRKIAKIHNLTMHQIK